MQASGGRVYALFTAMSLSTECRYCKKTPLTVHVEAPTGLGLSFRLSTSIKYATAVHAIALSSNLLLFVQSSIAVLEH